jgi:hypothetical protein
MVRIVVHPIDLDCEMWSAIVEVVYGYDMAQRRAQIAIS